MEERKGFNVPIEEQETTISYSRSGTTCNIWTSDQTTITKLDKLCKTAPQNYKVVAVGKSGEKVVSKEYKLQDKTRLSFRTTKTKKTDEQKMKAKELMTQLHKIGKL